MPVRGSDVDSARPDTGSGQFAQTSDRVVDMLERGGRTPHRNCHGERLLENAGGEQREVWHVGAQRRIPFLVDVHPDHRSRSGTRAPRTVTCHPTRRRNGFLMCGIRGIWNGADPAAGHGESTACWRPSSTAAGRRGAVRPARARPRDASACDYRGGDQPIFNEDGSVAVVFNGEIYNFRELRSARHRRRRVVVQQRQLRADGAAVGLALDTRTTAPLSPQPPHRLHGATIRAGRRSSRN